MQQDMPIVGEFSEDNDISGNLNKNRRLQWLSMDPVKPVDGEEKPEVKYLPKLSQKCPKCKYYI
jgi:hypothetical protein